jgi:ABC-2 type transport system permease protein
VRARDLGAGLVGDRSGRATARPSLLGTLGLAWRLQFSAVVGWAAGGAILGLFAGGLADAAVTAVQENKALDATVRGFVGGGTSGLLDTFVAAIMSFLGVLAAGAALQAVLHVRTDEAEGRAELLLAGPVFKGRLLVDSLALAFVSVVIVLLAGGLVTGLAFVGTGHPGRFGGSLVAAFVQLPAALVFAAVAALIFALVPRLTIGLGWGLLALGFLLGQFGGVFTLPAWLRDVSPFTHTPVVPGDNVDWTPLVVMFAISIVVAAVSVLLARRRDLVP